MQNNNSTDIKSEKKVKSIVKKINTHILYNKIGAYILFDILTFIVLWVSLILEREFAVSEEFVLDRVRKISFKGGIKDITLIISESDDRVIYSDNVYAELIIFLIIIGVFLCFQIISILFSITSERRKISNILNPINDLALKADMLSKFSYADDKYQIIEDAICNIKPDDAQKLSFGDKDLAGIEAAMNNLLIRMKKNYQQQSRFVNDASHELRTPIAVIKGYTDMLERWGKEDEKVLNESIAAIAHETNHMNKLVEQLLFLARGDSGRTTLEMEETSLNAIVTEVYEESLMIDENHIYRLKSSSEDIVLKVDPDMIKQVIRILVDNAAKYTESKQEIILGCARKDGKPYIMVQDSGIGMNETEASQAFDRFFRSDEARNKEGSGLGLSIAKWIVDKHNGHFEILSSPDIGTRFMIVFDSHENN